MKPATFVTARIVRCALACSLSAFAISGLAASSEPHDIDPEYASKVARERLKQRQQMSMRGGAAAGNNDQCGQVDIGNQDGKPSAGRRVNPRETTVIITGPVINAARCR
jgi:hypothetical protein